MHLREALRAWAFHRAAPFVLTVAHCDIPCGIYDPHHAQMAAHTVIRMNMLIDELVKSTTTDTPAKRREYEHKLARYTAVKEQHAELAKHEVRILWGDYFTPDHVRKYPELHELVWKALKAASRARQEASLRSAEDLLSAVNDIARIFWDTKGIATIKAKAAYPTEHEIVVPKLA